MENRCQISYQLAEIHPSVGREKEDYFAVVEGVFHRNQLHFEPVGSNFFIADTEGFLLFFAVFLKMSQILIGGNSQKLFEGKLEFLGNFGIFGGTDAAFHSLGGLDNYLLSPFDGHSVGIKIIRLTAVFKFNANYFGHFFNSIILSFRRTAPSKAGSFLGFRQDAESTPRRGDSLPQGFGRSGLRQEHRPL